MGIKGNKVQLMYQQREKSCSLNLLMTSFAKRHWQFKTIIAESMNLFKNSASQYIGAKKAEPLMTPLFNVNLFPYLRYRSGAR